MIQDLILFSMEHNTQIDRSSMKWDPCKLTRLPGHPNKGTKNKSRRPNYSSGLSPPPLPVSLCREAVNELINYNKSTTP